MGHPHHPGMHSAHPNAMMPDVKHEDIQYREWLRVKEMDLASRLDKAEQEQSSMKKRKKQLQNRQKQVCAFVCACMDMM